MDLTGKGFAHAPHSYLQHASGLAAAYSFAHTPLTTSIFKTGHSLQSPVYSGTLTTSLSPSNNSHTSFSNGHNISSLHRHVEKLTPDPSAKSQIYASPAPVFNRHKDQFPYGISGVQMPNYNYHGDVYQFTSNGYPRKSRTCSYCGKVFTRSTTRRYHEKRCPLLRAAVSSYMGDETSGSSNTTSQSAARSAGDIVTHSYKGPGQPPGASHSGTKRSNEPQDASTSMLNKSPSIDRRSGSESGILGGYQTSVIVKQEHHHEIKALASMTSNTSKHSLTESPDSEVSLKKQKLDSSIIMSPGYRESVMNLSLSKSPLNSINRNDNMGSGLNENYLLGPYGSRIQEREGAIEEKALPSLPSIDRDRYKVDLTTAESDEEELEEEDDDDLRPGSTSFSTTNGQDYKVDQLSEIGSVQGESESITSEKRDGKMYNNHKCGICGKGFESSGKLHLHEQLHTKFKPYSCKFCDQKFAKAAQRIEHEKTHNGSEEVTHICAVCGSSFTRKYSLKLHMRRWHQEGPWLCRHCGKASLTQKDLKTHLYSHNLPRLERESLLYMPDTPHNYGASNAESGSDKMGEHSDREAGIADDQPVGASNTQEMEMCQECGRDFPKGYLRYHLKSHEAQKPYSCPICAKRFGYKNNMKSHIKLHTGIKPFQCKVCGAKFTRGSTLRRHARRHGIIADSVWDLFVKPNYNKTGSSSVMENVESNYLAKTLPSTPSHSSLYPLYASLGHVPHLGLYPGLTSTSYFTQHLPQTSIYASSSQQLQPQQLDALNLSLNKVSIDQSDQSSFSNISAERSRSRSRSLSGSDNRRMLQAPDVPLQRDAATSTKAVQVNLCCPPLPPGQQQTALMKTMLMGEMARKSDDASGAGSNPPSLTPTSLQQMPSSPSAMAVVPYYVSSPSQRESSSPALSVSSTKDYSLETISSLISTGRMFKCFPCECYFSEYAMYRIHSKLHINDDTRPFVCMVCGEDCHDRVYFALHLSEHLR